MGLRSKTAGPWIIMVTQKMKFGSRLIGFPRFHKRRDALRYARHILAIGQEVIGPLNSTDGREPGWIPSFRRKAGKRHFFK